MLVRVGEMHRIMRRVLGGGVSFFFGCCFFLAFHVEMNFISRVRGKRMRMRDEKKMVEAGERNHTD